MIYPAEKSTETLDDDLNALENELEHFSRAAILQPAVREAPANETLRDTATEPMVSAPQHFLFAAYAANG